MNRRPVFWEVGALVLCIAAGVVVFSQVGSFLEAPAQSPEHADLIVALGGGSGTARVEKSFELYAQGFAPTILLTGVEGGPANAHSPSGDWRIRYLAEHGVPEHMLVLDAHATNSWEEAVNTFRLMREQQWQRVLVVSDPPHLRRVDWAWGKVFKGSGKDYRLITAPLDDWDPGRWWQNDKSARFVVTEVTKLAYYYVAH